MQRPRLQLSVGRHALQINPLEPQAVTELPSWHWPLLSQQPPQVLLHALSAGVQPVNPNSTSAAAANQARMGP
jgi:hypothetical protein